MKPRRLKRHPRAPYDWYVEPRWTVEALFDHHPMLGTVGDPACGMGTIPETARQRGFPVVACDIVDRGYEHLTAVADFLVDHSQFVGVENIVSNIPYSYRPGIADAFVLQALALRPATLAVLVPVNWLAGQSRFDLFMRHPPSRILYFSERPSMPPGHRIADMGSRAFKNGRVNYCWIIWNSEGGETTEASWIPPRGGVR